MMKNTGQVLRFFSNQMKNHTRRSSTSGPPSNEELEKSGRRLAAYCGAGASVAGGAILGFSDGVEKGTVLESTTKGVIKGAILAPVCASIAYKPSNFFLGCLTGMAGIGLGEQLMLLVMSFMRDDNHKTRRRP